MIRVKGPYLDLHDVWRGVYWRREGDGIRVYWCPVWCLVVRVDITPLHPKDVQNRTLPAPGPAAGLGPLGGGVQK